MSQEWNATMDVFRTLRCVCQFSVFDNEVYEDWPSILTVVRLLFCLLCLSLVSYGVLRVVRFLLNVLWRCGKAVLSVSSARYRFWQRQLLVGRLRRLLKELKGSMAKDLQEGIDSSSSSSSTTSCSSSDQQNVRSSIFCHSHTPCSNARNAYDHSVAISKSLNALEPDTRLPTSSGYRFLDSLGLGILNILGFLNTVFGCLNIFRRLRNPGNVEGRRYPHQDPSHRGPQDSQDPLNPPLLGLPLPDENYLWDAESSSTFEDGGCSGDTLTEQSAEVVETMKLLSEILRHQAWRLAHQLRMDIDEDHPSEERQGQPEGQPEGQPQAQPEGQPQAQPQPEGQPQAASASSSSEGGPEHRAEAEEASEHVSAEEEEDEKENDDGGDDDDDDDDDDEMVEEEVDVDALRRGPFGEAFRKAMPAWICQVGMEAEDRENCWQRATFRALEHVLTFFYIVFQSVWKAKEEGEHPQNAERGNAELQREDGENAKRHSSGEANGVLPNAGQLLQKPEAEEAVLESMNRRTLPHIRISKTTTTTTTTTTNTECICNTVNDVRPQNAESPGAPLPETVAGPQSAGAPNHRPPRVAEIPKPCPKHYGQGLLEVDGEERE